MSACGAIFRNDRRTPADLCADCGLPSATHLAVVLERFELPELRATDREGRNRLWRGLTVLEIGLWRGTFTPRLDLAWRSYAGGGSGPTKLGALLTLPLDAPDVFWTMFPDAHLGTWEREARERFGQPMTFADLDRAEFTAAILRSVLVARREVEIHDGVRTT